MYFYKTRLFITRKGDWSERNCCREAQSVLCKVVIRVMKDTDETFLGINGISGSGILEVTRADDIMVDQVVIS